MDAPYVYMVVRGIAVDEEEEDKVLRDVSDRLGSDYVVFRGSGTLEVSPKG